MGPKNPMALCFSLCTVCVRIRDDDETAISANKQNVTDQKTQKSETQACSSMSHNHKHAHANCTNYWNQ